MKTFMVQLVGGKHLEVQAEQMDVLPTARVIVLRAGGEAVAAIPAEQVRAAYVTESAVAEGSSPR